MAISGLTVADTIEKANLKFGTIVKETVQENRESYIAVKAEEGYKYFANCNPRLLRVYYELSKNSLITGKKITYPQIEAACPADPNLIRQAQAKKNN